MAPQMAQNLAAVSQMLSHILQ